MRLLLRTALMLALCAAAALAQRSHFYWMADAGGLSAAGNTSFQAGISGGGEIAIGKGFSAGPEMGIMAPREGRFWSTVMGVASANGYYHMRPSRSVRFDPYAVAGYSVLFRGDHANFFHYGVGMNYWVRPDLAFRTEFRDRTQSGHLWSFRIGVSFSHLLP